MKKIKFLTLSEVLLILEDQIRNYGGKYGVRDRNLLSSAIYYENMLYFPHAPKPN